MSEAGETEGRAIGAKAAAEPFRSLVQIHEPCAFRGYLFDRHTVLLQAI